MTGAGGARPAGAGVPVALSAVIVAVAGDRPRLVVVDRPAAGPGLPEGGLDRQGDSTLELGVRRAVRDQVGLDLGYVEQLYTFGDRGRVAGARTLSVAYLALTRQRSLSRSRARWIDWYDLLPWEDWRAGSPPVLDQVLRPHLERWASAPPDPAACARRRERVGSAFGLGAPWDGERALDRYELAYEAGLVAEVRVDQAGGTGREQDHPGAGGAEVGVPLVHDHRRIAATALSRLRGKLRYRPLVFELLPPTFTLLQLQRVVEALAGVALHKQNFRRFLEREGLVEGTGQVEEGARGRPAELFRFRPEVLRQRPSIGVTVPTLRPLA